MKKSFIFILIFLFIFSFSCTFNLFEGSVESNYKAIKIPAEKIEYARQILAGGDTEKISTITALLKADITAGVFGSDPALLAAANQIVGNLLVSESGFNDIVANAISSMATADPDNPPNLIMLLVDTNNDGTIDGTDLDGFVDMMEGLAEAAGYLNTAAQADSTNLDLQFQNVLANLAAGAMTIYDITREEAELQALTDYLNGTSPTPPDSYTSIETNINNIVASVDNMLANCEDQNSFYYSIASALQSMFAGIPR